MTDIEEIEKSVRIRLILLNATVQAVAFGAVCALGVFLATAWLLLKGGDVVGPHLALLGQYFVGYRVSWLGSVVGAAWGFAFGFTAGFVISTIYNRIASSR